MFDDRIQQSEIAADDWILGHLEAPVTLLEYGDFECPDCRQARPELEGLVNEHIDTIRLVYRHFPITTTHPHAAIAAEAAEAAGAQGRFWEMHDLLYVHQDRLDDEALHHYAESLQLDMRRFAQEMEDRVYESEVRRDFRLGLRDGVNGTPSIFINGVRYDGPRDHQSILSTLKTQLSR